MKLFFYGVLAILFQFGSFGSMIYAGDVQGQGEDVGEDLEVQDGSEESDDESNEGDEDNLEEQS